MSSPQSRLWVAIEEYLRNEVSPEAVLLGVTLAVKYETTSGPAERKVIVKSIITGSSNGQE